MGKERRDAFDLAEEAANDLENAASNEDEVVEDDANEKDVADDTSDVDVSTEDDTETDGDNVDVDPEDAYKPTFSYKVKGEEKEFDDRFKEIIKSKEDEEYVRDLYERADGLPHIKEHLNRLQTELGSYEKKYNEIDSQYNKVVENISIADKLLANGDPLGAMARMGLNKDQILAAAQALVGTPEEQEAYTQRSSMLQSKLEKEKEYQSLQDSIKQRDSALGEMRVRQAITDLNLELNRPEYSDVVSAYDEARGKNAFFEKVKLYGAGIEATGRTISVPDAVKAVYEEVAPFVTKKTQQPSTNRILQKKENKVPNLNGSGTPGKKKYSSMQEMIEAEGIDLT